MSEQIIFQSPSAILRYHPDGIVHHEFLTRMVGAAFRDVLNQGLTQLQKTHATKWLSDDRKNTVLEEADETWARSNWFPRAVAAGWKHWAIVNPQKAVGQLQMNRHAKAFEMGGITVQMFSTPVEALAWLRSVDASVKKAG